MDTAIGVDLKFMLLLEEKERKEKHVPSSFLDIDRPKKANTTFYYCYPFSWLSQTWNHRNSESLIRLIDLNI